MTKSLLVNEVFGATVQGEGPATGRRCAFVRLAMCNLRCLWCDTAYTWAFTEALADRHQDLKVYDRGQEVHTRSPEDVAEEAARCADGSRLVVISGGEPLLQTPPNLRRPDAWDTSNDPLGLLINSLYRRAIKVHIETAGTIRPSGFVYNRVEQFIVSPKLSTSGNQKRARYIPEVLDFFGGPGGEKTDFKFVVTNAGDFVEIDNIVGAHRIAKHRVWIMPEGRTSSTVRTGLQDVAPEAIRRGYNVSPRLHVDIWGDERGH